MWGKGQTSADLPSAVESLKRVFEAIIEISVGKTCRDIAYSLWQFFLFYSCEGNSLIRVIKIMKKYRYCFLSKPVYAYKNAGKTEALPVLGIQIESLKILLHQSMRLKIYIYIGYENESTRNQIFLKFSSI